MLTGLVMFLLLLITLLAIPIALTFQISWPQTSYDYIKLRWAFGLICLHFPLIHSKNPSPEDVELTQKIDGFRRSSHNKKKILTVIQQTTFRRRIVRFLSDFWHAVYKRDLSLHMRIGLGDPAETGQLWAVIGPVSGVLSNIKEISFEIEPEFFETTFEIDSSGNIRFIPIRIIYLAMIMLLSPPIWRGLRQMRNAE